MIKHIVVFVFALGLTVLIALSEAWAAWTIWQWKLAAVFPMAAPYVSLGTVFYLNLALGVCVRHFNPAVREEDEKKKAQAFLYFAISPFILVAVVWLLIRLGY